MFSDKSKAEKLVDAAKGAVTPSRAERLAAKAERLSPFHTDPAPKRLADAVSDKVSTAGSTVAGAGAAAAAKVAGAVSPKPSLAQRLNPLHHEPTLAERLNPLHHEPTLAERLNPLHKEQTVTQRLNPFHHEPTVGERVAKVGESTDDSMAKLAAAVATAVVGALGASKADDIKDTAQSTAHEASGFFSSKAAKAKDATPDAPVRKGLLGAAVPAIAALAVKGDRKGMVEGADAGLDSGAAALQNLLGAAPSKVDDVAGYLNDDLLPRLQQLIDGAVERKDSSLEDGALARLAGGKVDKRPKKGGFLMLLGLSLMGGAAYVWYTDQQRRQADPWTDRSQPFAAPISSTGEAEPFGSADDLSAPRLGEPAATGREVSTRYANAAAEANARADGPNYTGMHQTRTATVERVDESGQPLGAAGAGLGAGAAGGSLLGAERTEAIDLSAGSGDLGQGYVAGRGHAGTQIEASGPDEYSEADLDRHVQDVEAQRDAIIHGEAYATDALVADRRTGIEQNADLFARDADGGVPHADYQDGMHKDATGLGVEGGSLAAGAFAGEGIMAGVSRTDYPGAPTASDYAAPMVPDEGTLADAAASAGTPAEPGYHHGDQSIPAGADVPLGDSPYTDSALTGGTVAGEGTDAPLNPPHRFDGLDGSGRQV